MTRRPLTREGVASAKRIVVKVGSSWISGPNEIEIVDPVARPAGETRSASAPRSRWNENWSSGNWSPSPRALMYASFNVQ